VQPGRSTLMDPPIEDLLDKVDSKFTLVALGAARARQVNAYYNSLGEGLGRVVPPQVASVSGNPLSIAFEEIAAGKTTYHRVGEEGPAHHGTLAPDEGTASAVLGDAGDGGAEVSTPESVEAVEGAEVDRIVPVETGGAEEGDESPAAG